MQRYAQTIIDNTGVPLPSVTITVTLAGTATPATLYSSNAYAAKANPFVAGTDGVFSFYAANGRYDVALSKTGYTFDTEATYDIGLYDPATAITPTALAVNTNDYAPTNGLAAALWRVSASTAITLTGIVAGIAGQQITLLNVGSFLITLKNNSGSSAAANRLLVDVAVDYALYPNASVTLVYDGTTLMWRRVA